jgi:hypothetical protein
MGESMNTFRAILLISITFADINGRMVTVDKGSEITVTRLEHQLVSDTLDGKHFSEPVGSLIGTFGKHSFDIVQSEFQAIYDSKAASE